MAFTPFGDDLNIIAKLQDEPNDADGLTADELKAKFDEAGKLVQQYINGILLPEAAAEVLSALETAKLYTDEKVVQISSSDMAMAVYDPQHVQADMYAYADARAAGEADTVRQELVRAKWCGRGLIADSGSGGGGATGGQTYPARFTALHDPDGMLGENKETVTIPDGATRVLLSCLMRWGSNSFARAYIDVLINGIVVATKADPSTGGSYERTEEWFVLSVAPGDELTINLRAINDSGYIAAVYLTKLRLEVLK